MTLSAEEFKIRLQNVTPSTALFHFILIRFSKLLFVLVCKTINQQGNYSIPKDNDKTRQNPNKADRSLIPLITLLFFL